MQRAEIYQDLVATWAAAEPKTPDPAANDDDDTRPPPRRGKARRRAAEPPE